LISVVLTGLVYTLWLISKQRGFEEKQALTILMLVGCLFQNLLLCITSLPALLVLHTKTVINNSQLPFIIAGPVLTTMLFVIYYGGGPNGVLLFIIPGLFFTMTYLILQIRWVKMQRVSSLED
jgi:hypothetical protein